MFGAGRIGSNGNVPQWIIDVVFDVEQEYGFRLADVYYKKAKREDYYNGCYRHRLRAVQLYFRPEKTDIRLWAVLHELTHAIQRILYPETLTKKKSGRRNRVVHNQWFFETARKLYIKYGVLETAAQKEYKRARKMMVL